MLTVLLAIQIHLAKRKGIVGEHAAGDAHRPAGQVGGDRARKRARPVDRIAVGGRTDPDAHAIAHHRRLVQPEHQCREAKAQRRPCAAGRVGRDGTVQACAVGNERKAWRQAVGKADTGHCEAGLVGDGQRVVHEVAKLGLTLAAVLAQQEAQHVARVQWNVVMHHVAGGAFGVHARDDCKVVGGRIGGLGRRDVGHDGPAAGKAARCRRDEQRRVHIATAGRGHDRNAVGAQAGDGRRLQVELVGAVRAGGHRHAAVCVEGVDA